MCGEGLWLVLIVSCTCGWVGGCLLSYTSHPSHPSTHLLRRRLPLLRGLISRRGVRERGLGLGGGEVDVDAVEDEVRRRCLRAVGVVVGVVVVVVVGGLVGVVVVVVGVVVGGGG